jgi:3'-phosphoadenosine 5'-phosphosulfate (PAPS) 3'-phosphatase
MEWDTAAGQAVLEAAGGTVVVADGSPLRYGKRAEGYANPAFFAGGADAAAIVKASLTKER